MSAEVLRRAAALMRERAEAATPGPWKMWDGWGPTTDGLMGFSRLGPDTGERVLHHEDMRDIYATRADAEHIASWHPDVALAVADWLDAVAAVHWPKRHDRYSGSHYNAEPEHDHLSGDCDESCWTEAYICNGCGTAECKSEISGRALVVARAYLGETE